MKGIIIDLNNLTDSKEYYERRPNRALSGFIYVVTVLLVAAVVFSFFGKIEMVSTGSGVIRPNERVSTVSGMTSGRIATVQYTDGATVSEGDILLLLDCTDLQLDLTQLQATRETTQRDYELWQKYLNCIQTRTNVFSSDPQSDEFPFYVKYSYYDTSLKDKTLTTSFEEEENRMSMAWLENQLTRQTSELEGLKLLRDSIQNNTNLVERHSRYNYQFLLYQMTMDSITRDYNRDRREIEQNASEDIQQMSIDFYTRQLEGYKKLLRSIESGSNLFSDDSMYSKLYEDYAYSQKSYEWAKENAEINLEAGKDANSSAYELEIAQKEVENADRAIQSHDNKTKQEIESNIQEIELKLKEMKAEQNSSQDRDTLLKELRDVYEQSTKDNYWSTLQQIEESIKSLEDSTLTNHQELKRLQYTGEYYENNVNSENDNIPTAFIRLGELQTCLDTLNALEKSLHELDYNIAKTTLDIEAATIRAMQSGVINSTLDIAQGDILEAGTLLATIIPPDESQFKIQIYMDNKDIAGIEAGDLVKYNINALPSSQYGTLQGTVLSVSKDAKTVGGEAQSSYYLVEASLDNQTLRDKNGNEAEITVGMSLNAKVVKQEKRIIFYLLEKINLF